MQNNLACSPSAARKTQNWYLVIEAGSGDPGARVGPHTLAVDEGHSGLHHLGEKDSSK